ncbi:MAG: ADOP family duplicated permease [Vicinamibacterales bacterium]
MSRLGGLRLDPARAAEIIDELSQHLDQRYDELLSDGATADDSYRTAVSELLDAQALATAMRPLRQARVAPRQPRDPRLARLAADLRISIRTLFRQRAFTIAVVLTFAIGIGAASAIATIVDSVLLRPLPYPDAERIVQVVHYRKEGAVTRRGKSMARPYLLGLDQRSRSFAAFGVYDSFSNITRRRLTMNVTGSSGTAALLGTRMSPVLFGMLGATPQAGRLLIPGDDLPERNRVIILSDRSWRAHYGGDAGVIGTSLTIDGRPYTLVGIMSPGFAFPDAQTDFWIPYTSAPGLAPSEPRSDTPNSYYADGVFARLRDDVTIEAASAETDALLRTLSLEDAAATGRKPEDTGFPPSLARRGEVVSMKDEMTAPVRPMLRMLAAAGALLLLIACANLVTLFLERSDSRRTELEVRRALGATRGQILRQFVVDGVVLSAAGGAAGAALAYWMVQLAVLVVPSDVPRASEIAVTAPVLASAIAAAVVLGVLLSVGSAWPESRRSAQRDGGRPPRRSPISIVVAEVALAVVLCVGAGLLVRSFIGLVNVNPGYDTRDVTTFQLVPPFGHTFDPTRVYEEVLSRLRADPAIQAVAATDILPVAGASAFHLNLGGLPVAPGSDPMTLRIVTRQYFQAMGMRLVEGRTFAEASAVPFPELVLSEEFVRRYFPGKSPLGQILDAGPTRYQVVGVVNDARQSGLNARLRAEYYVDLARFGLTEATRPHFVVRSGADTSFLGPLIRSTVRNIDSRLGVDLNQQTMAELTSASVATPRFNTFVLSAFAVVALALAIVGIYGMLSHAVTRRTQEIGIRMAVGAAPSQVLAMILRHSLMVTGTGAAVGLLMAAGTTRYLESMLFELTPLDPWTFLAVAAMALVVAVLAAYPPAARASRVDPLVALRHH